MQGLGMCSLPMYILLYTLLCLLVILANRDGWVVAAAYGLGGGLEKQGLLCGICKKGSRGWRCGFQKSA